MFDRLYRISDLYYPHVGMENHAMGHFFRLGVYADGNFSWTTDWPKVMKYVDDTLVTDVTLSSDPLELKIHANDCVDFVSPIYLKKLQVTNTSSVKKEVRIFFAHDYYIKGSNIGDTAYFDPVKSHAVVHYKADRYFLMNCQTEAGEGIFQYACGVKDIGTALGTWKDAEDGSLSGSPIAQGSVDSVISARLNIDANSTSNLFYWIAAGKTYDEVERRDSLVKSRSPQKLMKRTSDFWKLWVMRGMRPSADLDPQIMKLYRRSLLTIKTQTDSDGAVIAANDTDILQFNKDTYSYMWPRDGALVTIAMDSAGYPIFSQMFFGFCSKVILPMGWFFHKYQPDGSPGSSWHPWIIGDKEQLPLQEDETALVLIALWKNFEKYKDVDSIKSYYRPIVKAAANFMASYRDPVTRLPLESYDLWEERRAVLTFTACAVQKGLECAANFARAFGEDDIYENYNTAAQEVREAILKNLYDPALGRFVRGIAFDEHAIAARDDTVDSSLAGVFLFDVLPPDDPMVVSTMKQVEERLSIKTPVGGVARYEGDSYQRQSNHDPSVPGNPWFVCTLWLAEWYVGIAKSKKDLDHAKELLNWCNSHALPSGILAEQLNPLDGQPVSVSPLTWSHAAYVDAVDKYVAKYNSMPA
jgi:GH15 family glucan-1,4-alpha-glucosidase